MVIMVIVLNMLAIKTGHSNGYSGKYFSYINRAYG